MGEAASDIVDQVATAILSETPANYVSQSIAQAYRNAEIALAIIGPAIRANERERIAQAVATRLDEMFSDWSNPRYQAVLDVIMEASDD